jgi:hypothetical protein
MMAMTTTLIVVTPNLEPPAMSFSNLFSIDSVCQLELREEGFPSKFNESHPFVEEGIVH